MYVLIKVRRVVIFASHLVLTTVRIPLRLSCVVGIDKKNDMYSKRENESQFWRVSTQVLSFITRCRD